MSAMTLPQTNGAKASAASEAWKQATVQAFFTHFNWEDRPPTTPTLTPAEGAPANVGPLSLGMSVCQFFAMVNWDGTTIAAATPVPEQPPAPSNDLTLDDFSGLF